MQCLRAARRRSAAVRHRAGGSSWRPNASSAAPAPGPELVASPRALTFHATPVRPKALLPTAATVPAAAGRVAVRAVQRGCTRRAMQWWQPISQWPLPSSPQPTKPRTRGVRAMAVHVCNRVGTRGLYLERRAAGLPAAPSALACCAPNRANQGTAAKHATQAAPVKLVYASVPGSGCVPVAGSTDLRPREGVTHAG